MLRLAVALASAGGPRSMPNTLDIVCERLVINKNHFLFSSVQNFFNSSKTNRREIVENFCNARVG